MKLALSFLLFFAVTLPRYAFAHDSFLLTSNTVQTTQRSKVTLKVNTSQQAAQMAKARLGGKVLKVQKKKTGYRVKLIKSNGHIVSVFIDARSGRISGGH